MGPRSASSPLANPVLVGAVTLLVTFVAVFLAYNANNGLPFVPTTLLRVESPSGANIVKGNEVRSGGFRIGVVKDLAPTMLSGNRVGAVLELKLDKKLGAIPRDSTVAIRPRSALGLKYVELTTGRSKQTFRDGDTLPIRQTRIPVEIDEVFSIFDRPTREASQGNLQEFGNALAGRGQSLGQTFEVLPELAGALEPVMRNLSDPRTDLPGFFRGLERTVSTLAPVSKTQARLFTTMADTFEAISRDPRALQDTIAKSPPTLDVATESLRVQRPFLDDFAAFSADLRGAATELRASLPTINDAVERGIPVQRRAVKLDDQLRKTFKTLDDVTDDPGTNAGLRGLTETVGTLNPTVRFVGPYITVCNGWNYFWTHNAEHFSEEDSTGHAQRALLNNTGRQDNSLSQMGASEPANGEDVNPGDTPQFLQGQPYGAAIGPDGRADCEFGQRGFLRRQARYAPKKYNVVNDPRTPGLQGPTPTGLPRVPAGQTFTDKPETGPYKDFPVSEFGGE
ncbi:MAG TPA: MlaD family protein [Solirubrobacteraceae bacterium]|jgi:virulence factor Mce-like protein